MFLLRVQRYFFTSYGLLPVFSQYDRMDCSCGVEEKCEALAQSHDKVGSSHPCIIYHSWLLTSADFVVTGKLRSRSATRTSGTSDRDMQRMARG